MPENYPIFISNHYPLLTHPAPRTLEALILFEGAETVYEYPMSESYIPPLLSVHLMYTLVRRAWLFWRLSFILAAFRSLPCF